MFNKKRKEIKRLDLTYIGNGIYKSITRGSYWYENIQGEIYNKCEQEMTSFWEWSRILRRFNLISYNLQDNKL